MTKFVTLSIERLNQVIGALNGYCSTGEIDCADDLVAELLAERDQTQYHDSDAVSVVQAGSKLTPMVSKISFLQELKQYLHDSNASYFKEKVEEIKNEIRKHALSGGNSAWITFYWEDGDYKKIIDYFKKEGIKVCCPTGSDQGFDPHTSYLFKWHI